MRYIVIKQTQLFGYKAYVMRPHLFGYQHLEPYSKFQWQLYCFKKKNYTTLFVVCITFNANLKLRHFSVIIYYYYYLLFIMSL